MFTIFKSARDYNVIANSSYILFSKLLRALIGFLLVPIMLKSLDRTEYGVWLIIFSLFNWISLFDLGVANGLRIRLIEAVSDGDFLKARKLVSTSYIVLGGFLLTLIIFFLILNTYVNWYTLLNAPQSIKDLNSTIFFCGVFLLLNFWTSTINQIFIASNNISFVDMLLLFSDLIVFVFIFILHSYFTNISLYLTGIVFTVIPFIVSITSNFYFFSKRYQYLSPSFMFFDSSLISEILEIGIKFFIIQFCGLVLFQSQNLYLSHKINPESVAIFQTAYKYYSLSFLALNVLTLPYYPIITAKFKNRELDDIVSIFKVLMFIWLFIVVLLFALLISAPYIFPLWLGNAINIPFYLSVSIVIWLCFHILCTILFGVLFSIGKISLQTIIAILALPFTYLLISMSPNNLNVSTIPNVNAIYLFINSIIMFYQLRNLQCTQKLKVAE